MVSIKPLISFLSIGLLLISGGNVYAQKCKECIPVPLELRGYVKASLMNSLYQDPTGANFDKLTSDYKDSDEQRNYWRVYSDRGTNTLYLTPSGRANKKTLSFMEQLYVTSRQGNWLKVSKLENIDGDLEYVDNGWIPAKNLLLNTYALSNEQSITKKGLVLVNLDDVASFKLMIKAAEQGQSLKQYTFYEDPAKRVVKGNETELEIRYVIKELQGMKLLSRNDRLDNISEANLKYNVNGWMANVNITDWDTRVCLEPTHGQAYAEVYQDKTIPVFIEESQLDAFVTNNIDKPSQEIYSHLIKEKRKSTVMMRMPILKNFENSDKKKVATLGSVSGKTGDERNEIKSNAKQEVEALRTKRNNINILFVVDATKSMDDFFPAVKSGVQKIISLNNERFKKEMRFSVAVYRDYEDGEKDFENIPLTDNTQDIYNFLAKVKIGSVGKAREEAQYNGIIRGVKESLMDPDQSNIIVLIGDAGNISPDAKGHTKNVVSNLLVAYNASLVTFQVFYGIQPAYETFNNDAIDYFYDMGKKTDKKQNLKPNLAPIPGQSNSFELKFKDPATNVVDYYVEAGFGRFIYADDNKPLPISVLQSNLTDAIDNYLRKLDEDINRYNDLLRNGTSKVKSKTEFDEANVQNLKDHLRDQGFSEDEIDIALESFAEFSMSGFTNVRFYSKPLDCFTPVVFLSDEEVDNMIRVFDKVDPEANLTDSKTQISDALIAQTKAALGENSDERVKQKSMSEIWNILLAVPFDEKGEYGTLRDIPIGDIPNSNHPSLLKFILQFQESIRRFNKKNLEEDRFRLNSQFYYWVPIEKIPGNG